MPISYLYLPEDGFFKNVHTKRTVDKYTIETLDKYFNEYEDGRDYEEVDVDVASLLNGRVGGGTIERDIRGIAQLPRIIDSLSKDAMMTLIKSENWRAISVNPNLDQAFYRSVRDFFHEHLEELTGLTEDKWMALTDKEKNSICFNNMDVREAVIKDVTRKEGEESVLNPAAAASQPKPSAPPMSAEFLAAEFSAMKEKVHSQRENYKASEQAPGGPNIPADNDIMPSAPGGPRPRG